MTEPTTAIVLARPPDAPVVAPAPPADLIGIWLANRPDTTRAAYLQAVRLFAQFAGLGADPENVVRWLLAQPLVEVYRVVARWMVAMNEANLAPKTVRSRVGALRGLIAKLGTLGLLSWSLQVTLPPDTRRREVRGPTRDEFQRLLDAAGHSDTAARDTALLWCFASFGIRLAGLAGLRWPEDVDLDHDGRPSRIRVRMKGRGKELTAFVVPDSLRAVMARRARELTAPGPFFGLAAKSIYFRLRALGKVAAAPRWNPHSFRHMAATLADKLVGREATTELLCHEDAKTAGLYFDDKAEKRNRASAAVADELMRLMGRAEPEKNS